MKIFTEPLKHLKVYEDLVEAQSGARSPVSVSGCSDTQKVHLMSSIGTDRCRLIVTFQEQRAREIVESFRFFQGKSGNSVLYFPAKDILFYQSDVRGNALTTERIQVYRALAEEQNPVIVTTFDALMDKITSPEIMKQFTLTFTSGAQSDPEKAAHQLTEMGYQREYQVGQPGEFAVRGGILDVFPLTEEVPYRIEFWGDEVDSIRTFAVDTQRSLDTQETIRIYPASEMVLTDEQLQEGLERIRKSGDKLREKYRSEMKTEEAHRIREMVDQAAEQIKELRSTDGLEGFRPFFGEKEDMVSLLDCLLHRASDTLIFVDEPVRSIETGRTVEKEFADGMQQRLEKGYLLPEQMNLLFPESAVTDRLDHTGAILLSALETRIPGIHTENDFYMNVRPVGSYNSSMPMLVKDLQRFEQEKDAVVLLCASRSRAKRMADDLRQEGLHAYFTDDPERTAMPGEILTVSGSLRNGFAYPDIHFVVLTETDIFGTKKKKRRRHRTYDGQSIQQFSDLHPGDYVVHESHGLGIYRGIERIEVDKKVKDYIKIEYAQGGVLYVLATQLDAIQKYAGSDAKKPKLNRLGTTEWSRTRARVQKAVGEIAQELVELYAVRQNKKGYQFEPDTPWQKEFEESFPYEETDDQLRAIRETKEDMESTKIMDRLICGDVGFGKTEVAIRAAFKAVQENKQVVFLVPTTILAQQHYNTFVQRMKDYPVNIELICRFRTPAQIRKSLERLEKGLSDIAIGTHRVLSKDVHFKNLGLLIIDEEQRFGVTQKERIKQMKNDVDVLTLTATPIPRTLHMSLAGIRDMSVLEEAPRDRLPVQTYVMEYNEEMVREAIERELARSGQVFYVYNRVSSIADMAARISALVPDAEVAYAHGRMSERQLENIMYDFMNGDIDVLVTTTIIETGLDIANANTMIIHDADRMGLSQLYQLRGRIGRSNRTSYAFLMYQKNKILREVAEKRLSAIRDFSETGSGFRIAMKDLEIRGAGNVLGEAQSGHMEAVGYDLYCKMLNDAVRTARGEKKEESFETALDLKTDAYIPPAYIPNETQKLDIYKRIAAIETEEDRDEMLDELIDRFGEPPKKVQKLLDIAILRARAHRAWFTEIKEKDGEIIFRLYERAAINAANISALVKKYRGRLTFTADAKQPYFVYHRKKQDPDTISFIEEFLQQCQETIVLHEK